MSEKKAKWGWMESLGRKSNDTVPLMYRYGLLGNSAKKSKLHRLSTETIFNRQLSTTNILLTRRCTDGCGDQVPIRQIVWETVAHPCVLSTNNPSLLNCETSGIAGDGLILEFYILRECSVLL